MWAKLIKFETSNILVPTATFRIDAVQAELIWRGLRAAPSTLPLDEVEFEIVVKKTAEAIGD